MNLLQYYELYSKVFIISFTPFNVVINCYSINFVPLLSFQYHNIMQFIIRECGSTLYVGMCWKQNGRPYNARYTNKQDLTFKNHPEVVSDDFLGDLCIYCCQIQWNLDITNSIPSKKSFIITLILHVCTV